MFATARQSAPLVTTEINTGEEASSRLLRYIVAKANYMPEPHRKSYLAGSQSWAFNLAEIESALGMQAEEVDDALCFLHTNDYLKVETYSYGYRFRVWLRMPVIETVRYP